MSTQPASIWVIIPAHNRRETTLRCLEHLKQTQKWERFNVIVVDDGSTDGTGEMIEAEYPSVTVLYGDGSLWWGGAILKGMKYAKEQQATVFIWLNDDVLPEPGGITKLADKVETLQDTILTTVVYNDQKPAYTTRKRRTKNGIKQMPYNTDVVFQPCDTVAGKFTAFPRTIIEEIGLPDASRFPQHYCDFDYALRGKEHGFEVGVYSEVVAHDTGDDYIPPRLSEKVSFEDVFLNTFSMNPPTHRIYNVRSTYYLYFRFYKSSKLLCCLNIAYQLLRSVGALIIKLALVIMYDHDLRTK